MVNILEESRSLRRYTVFKSAVTNSAGNYLTVIGSWVIVPDFAVTNIFITLVSIVVTCSTLNMIMALKYSDSFEEERKRVYERVYYFLTILLDISLGVLLVHQGDKYGFLSTPHLGTWVFIVASIESHASYLYHKPKIFFCTMACLHFPNGIWLLSLWDVVPLVLSGITFGYAPMIMDRVKQLKYLSDRTIDAIVDGQKQRELNDQSLRLANLGRMASGIAHEINNPLAIADGLVNISQMNLEKGNISVDDLNSKFDKIRENHERIKEVVLKMKGFSFEVKSRVLEEVSFYDIVVNELSIFNEKISTNHIVLKYDELSKNLTFLGKREEIIQILLSFYTNSIDAIISSEDLEIKEIEFSSNETQNEIIITITDTGNSLDDVSEIFVPFYTTKSPGEGFGLGLSLSQYLANSYGGRIEGSRQDGKTIFSLILPRSRD